MHVLLIKKLKNAGLFKHTQLIELTKSVFPRYRGDFFESNYENI